MMPAFIIMKTSIKQISVIQNIVVLSLPQMESSTQEVHKSLNTILDYQTHHRLREAQGRKRAEDLNERVMWWSSIEFVVVLLASTLQVYIVKNFFASRANEKRYQPVR